MGASSSGLLDEAKISHIKGLVDSSLQSFSVFYRQQYAVAYFKHLHQEVEPKNKEKGLLLAHRPQYPPDEILYQSSVRFSCWDDQGKKCRERVAVLRRDYRVEIHDNMEVFSRGGAAKLVLQPAGASVFTTEEESRAHLEKTCAGILNGVKEDSPSVMSSPDVFAVYLHLPYRGHTCFLFQLEEERHHFLSALKTCIRHGNLDPWRESSYESQAFTAAFRLHQQDRDRYQSRETLLGTQEQVLTSQVMEDLLPWLRSQLQPRLKGKRSERIRQWLATLQASYVLVEEQLTAALDALRDECRRTASANQALIRSNLDQIMSSHAFLEQKVRDCIGGEAERVCRESVSPHLLSILETLTENISAGILQMQDSLQSQMTSALFQTKGGSEEMKKAMSSLSSTSLDPSYQQVEKLSEKLVELKERFGLKSPQRLVHSAHRLMEQLLDSAVYTLDQYLQSSSRLQASQVTDRMERAKERVLKQLDYDSRLLQKRLYEESLLEITLPSLTRQMDSMWKTELQQFEQYIFSDYSSFILVTNVFHDVLRNTLSAEIQTVVQEAASKRSKNLLLDTDLALSQYSLLGPTPPRSAPDSPNVNARDSTPAPPSDNHSAPTPVEKEEQETTNTPPQSRPELDTKCNQTTEESTTLTSTVIVSTEDGVRSSKAECNKENNKEVFIGADKQPTQTDESPNNPQSQTELSTKSDRAMLLSSVISESPEPKCINKTNEDVQIGADLTETDESPNSPEKSFQTIEESTTLPCPVILVTQNEDESPTPECIKKSNEEVLIGIDMQATVPNIPSSIILKTQDGDRSPERKSIKETNEEVPIRADKQQRTVTEADKSPNSPKTKPELDAKSDQTTEESTQRAVSSSVILKTQDRGESLEPKSIEKTNEEVQIGAKVQPTVTETDKSPQTPQSQPELDATFGQTTEKCTTHPSSAVLVIQDEGESPKPEFFIKTNEEVQIGAKVQPTTVTETDKSPKTPQSRPELHAKFGQSIKESTSLPSPVIPKTQLGSESLEPECTKKTNEEVQIEAKVQSTTVTERDESPKTLMTKPELDAKSVQTTEERSTTLQSPVIVVTEDGFGSPELERIKETNEEIQVPGDRPSIFTVKSSKSAAVEVAVSHPPLGHEVTIQEPADSSLLTPLEANIVNKNPVNFSSSENNPSIQVPGEDQAVKISLGSLSEAIDCTSAEVSVTQTTDRAVYLTGEIRNNWERERLKEGSGAIKGNKMEDRQTDDVVRVMSEPLDEGDRSSGSAANALTPEQTGSEERKKEAVEEGDHKNEEKEAEKMKVLQSQTVESTAEGPLDSVAMIRELVTEVYEVETLITPCPESTP